MGVQEGVLGLVVKEPGYGYQIGRRLGDRFSTAAVYKALAELQDLDLIEPVEVLEEGVRPRKWYRATTSGESLHREIVAKTLRKRLENATPESISAVIDEIDLCEQRALQELQRSPEQDDLVHALIADERRSVSQARLEWAARSRERINASPST